MFTKQEEIEEWLDKMGINNYTINSDLTVDVATNVNLECKKLKSFPVQFGKVQGNFHCSHNQLISLKGSPREISGRFLCSYNQLKTLEGGPSIVDSDYTCSKNMLRSLRGFPTTLKYGFNANSNALTSLEYLPSSINGLLILSNNNLTTFKDGPMFVSGGLYVDHNKELSLDTIKTKIGDNDLYCGYNKMETLKQLSLSDECRVIMAVKEWEPFQELLLIAKNNPERKRANTFMLTVGQIKSIYLSKKLNEELPNKESYKKVKI